MLQGSRQQQCISFLRGASTGVLPACAWCEYQSAAGVCVLLRAQCGLATSPHQCLTSPCLLPVLGRAAGAGEADLPWTGMTFGLTISAIWYWCSDQVSPHLPSPTAG